MNLELNTDAVRVGSCGDRSFDVTAWVIGVEELHIWKSGDIDWADWIVFGDGRIAQGTGYWKGCCLRLRKTEECSYKN